MMENYVCEWTENGRQILKVFDSHKELIEWAKKLKALGFNVKTWQM